MNKVPVQRKVVYSYRQRSTKKINELIPNFGNLDSDKIQKGVLSFKYTIIGCWELKLETYKEQVTCEVTNNP